MIKNHHIAPDAAIAMSKLLGGGMLSAAEIQYVLKAAANPNAYFRGKVNEANISTTIADAYDKTITGRNDVVLLSPDSHSQAAALTWARNMTHLIGMYPVSMMNHRSRIGHSVTVSPLLTVSGYGNLFANLYFMYGTAVATDLNLLTVSGDRNTFDHCHFGGPMSATPADEADFDLVRLNCGEVYFNKCVFGIQTINWTDGNMISMYGPADRSVRAIFDDCIFLMQADNAQVNFIETTAGQGAGFAIFRGCQFLNVSGTALTLAIDGAGTGNFKLYFDINCIFAGITDIIGASYEANCLCGHGGYVSADKLNNLIATTPDVS